MDLRILYHASNLLHACRMSERIWGIDQMGCQSPSAPGIYPRTCRQQWTSSCPKGQSSQCSIQKPRVSSAVSFLVPRTQGFCVLSQISPTWMTIWSFHSSRWKYWGISQVVHQREQMDNVHWHTGCISAHPHGKACTEIPSVHGQWSSVPVQLHHLPLGIYQGGQVTPRGQAACLPGLLAYLHLMPVQARTHANLVLQVLQLQGWVINFSKSDFLSPWSQQFNFIGMQFNMCTYTVAPLPKRGVKIENTLDHWRSQPRVAARDFHNLLGMLTFRSTLVPRGQLFLHPIQWWASEAWCQETGSWSDRISVTPTILHQVTWWFSPAVLQGVSRGALEAGIRGRDQMPPATDGGTAGLPWAARDVVQAAGKLAHQSVRDGGSAPECSRVLAST